MRRSHTGKLTLGLILAGAVNLAASSSEASARITVNVKDYANVDAKTLFQAGQVATEVYEEAGVKIDWINLPKTPTPSSVDATGSDQSSLSALHINILSDEMTKQFGMAKNVMGFAPGEGPDRRLVYVFYSSARRLAQKRTPSNPVQSAAIPQILGEMMAHELGHVLLNLASHSESGVMKGVWDLRDMWNAGFGDLLFTSQQAAALRKEAARRTSAAAYARLQDGACLNCWPAGQSPASTRGKSMRRALRR